jgi:aryl-alcohol dehydrogenase-like predicted oxidoreductase
MNYRKLGHSGLYISDISLGSWLTYGNAVGDKVAFKCLDKALELGVNFLDTADVYNAGGAEKTLGKYLKEQDRTKIILGTKVYFQMSDHHMDKGLSARHIWNSVRASLDRLKTDYIDLYQCHRYDTATPLEETCYTMHQLIERGLVRYWGVSQWSAVQIVEAVKLCERNGWRKPVSNQPIYNLLNRSLEVEVMDVCERYGLGLVVYSPLGQGLLTGKYTRETIPSDSRAGSEDTAMWFPHKRMTDETFEKIDKLKTVARDLKLELPVLALAWTLRLKPVTSAIIGASKPEQIVQNVLASGQVIPADALAEIETILGNAPRDQYTGSPNGYNGN